MPARRRRARGRPGRSPRKRDGLRPSLTAAARDGSSDRRSGRQDGRVDRTTGCALGIGLAPTAAFGDRTSEGWLVAGSHVSVVVIAAEAALSLLEQLLQLDAVAEQFE